jgi:glycosyltransferase involved in cell wall biosynthesis
LKEGAPNRYGTRWPPVRLPFDWLRHAPYDVLHVQFDFDVYTAPELRDIVSIVRARGIPLVFTVHDLRTTTREEPGEHEERLDVLVSAADALVTLTPGAAEAIHRSWGREAVVVPHPHVVDFQTMERSRRRRELRQRDSWHLGVHLRWLRANMDAAVVPVLAEAVRELPTAVLDVFIHHDALEDPSRDPQLTSYLRSAAAEGTLHLHPHEEMTDPELWESLTELDATVLPYRFGTHSGWLEACRDLGTTVIVPSCGYYVEQGPTLGYRLDDWSKSPGSLRAAVRKAYEERPDFGATVSQRWAQRKQIAAAHDRLYRSLLSRQLPSGDTSGLIAR